MAKFTSILLLSYYCFAVLFLPQADFAAVTKLPEMYEHCKATEDHDMTPLDFLTDHLLNIDGLFDKHENGDEQKPHSPIQFHQPISFTSFVSQPFRIVCCKQVVSKKSFRLYTSHIHTSDYASLVFRPPIV